MSELDPRQRQHLLERIAAWRYGCLVRHPWPTLRSFLTPFLRSAAMLALARGSMYYGSHDDERA